MASHQVALKIAFNGDIHRTRVDLRGFSLAELTHLMAQTFHQSVGDFVVQYRDPEGDCVNVTTDAEFQEAVRVFLDTHEAIPSLRFSAITKRQAEFQETVAEPLIASVEQLMQALAGTLEKLKQDTQFASSAAANTSVAVPLSTKASADSPKTAVGGFSSFAQGLVGQINRFIPEKKAGEATMAPIAVPVSTPEPEETQQLSEMARPLPSVQVEKAPPAQETEETPSIASSVAFSEAELKWAEPLSIVSSICPNVSPARIIDILEKSHGDLNVVLNVLTEAQ